MSGDLDRRLFARGMPVPDQGMRINWWGALGLVVAGGAAGGVCWGIGWTFGVVRTFLAGGGL